MKFIVKPCMAMMCFLFKDLQFDCPLGEKCCKNEFKNHNDKEVIDALLSLYNVCVFLSFIFLVKL